MTLTNTPMQHTLASCVLFKGIGLHTGHEVSLVVKPAPEDKGFVFVRTDLDGCPEIPVEVDYVVNTSRGTTVAKDGAVVHTIEHLMSALTGIGMDNAILELTSDEIPALDGSSVDFCRAFLEVGLVEQTKPRSYLNLKEPVTIETKDMFMVALPYDGLRISFTIEYDHSYLAQQAKSYNYSEESFLEEISSARTFCFDFEIDFLRKADLIKGGSLDNAVVVTETGVLNESIRFEDEFVRHKILDIIGDLTLLGQRVKAHVIAHKSGHSLNVELVKALKKHKITQTGEGTSGEESLIKSGEPLDINQIKKIIPHRYPFLLIDRIIETDGHTKATGLKNVSINESFFQGHFPGHPVMPGVLILEALAQTAACLMTEKSGNDGKIAYFMSLDQVKFRRPVRPGDTLLLKVEIVRMRNKIKAIEGQAFVNDEVVAEGQFKFAFVDEIQ